MSFYFAVSDHTSYQFTYIFMILEVWKEFYSYPLWQNSSGCIVKVKKISYIHTGGMLMQEICLSVQSTTIPSENSCTYQ